MERLILILIFSFGISSCTSNSPKRADGHDIQPTAISLEGNPAIIETRNKGTVNEYDMVFIEFDDQGLLHDPNLKSRALEHLEKVTVESSIIVIFTHGWHHNASPKDDNVKSFQKLLSQLGAIPESSARKDLKEGSISA